VLIAFVASVFVTVQAQSATPGNSASQMPSSSGNSSVKFDGTAVWQVTPEFIATAPMACEKANDNAECLMGQMVKAGAPAAAVSFTRALYGQSRDKQGGGDFGVMTGFHKQGKLAFGWIRYPMRANTNNGLLLLNGDPAIVNLEDLTLLDTKTMKASTQFQNVQATYPKVDVWPGDRDGKTWPEAQAGPNGGTQFVLLYPLRNGCHACARGGSAIFTWNFDARGKFLGTTFVGMLAPPL
jgi:hypothetical protein